MIAPIKLATRVFPTNLIQGPLAGVSCAPFRALTWEYSQPAFSCTEMISCKTLLHQPLDQQQRFVKIDKDEGPVSFQLSGNNSAELAEATKRATNCGADLIDLNCGCPVKKTRNKGAGSSLLTNTSQLYDLIRTMKANTHVPVSIKIRVEGNSTDKFNQEVANVVSDAGADFLVVHGRHWTEHYETACHYDDIQFFVDTLSIPVIGNGDIACLASLTKMFTTGCAGVMIGRAGVGQPWLIRQLTAEYLQQDFLHPGLAETGATFVKHARGLVALLGEEKFAILQARKLAKYYARRLPTKFEFCQEINSCDTIARLEMICDKHFNFSLAFTA